MVSFDKFLLRKDLLFATSNERAISARLLVFLEACIANARVLGKDSTIHVARARACGCPGR